MRLTPQSLRGQLFATSLMLVIVAGSVSGLYLKGTLRDFTEERLARELHAHAATAGVLLETVPPGAFPAGIARRLSVATGARITIVDRDGHVLQDSWTDSPLETHQGRPEFQQAARDGIGRSQRFSSTTGQETMYVAVAVGDRAYVRAALPLDQLDSLSGQVVLLMVVAGLVGLVVAAAMSLLASHLAAREMRKLVRSARGLVTSSRDVAGSDTEPGEDHEMSALAGSLNRMATSLERTMGELAAERDRFATVIRSMGEALLAVDSERRVTLANDAAIAAFGLSDSPVGRALAEVTRSPALDELVTSAMSSPSSAELEMPMKAGRPKRLLTRARPLGDGGGVLLVALDVTEMRRLETIRRDFIANVSHELRTPVSVITANAETLLSGGLHDARRAPLFVEAIGRNAARLASLIADILDLARIEAGHYALHPVPSRLAPLVQGVVAALDVVAEKRRTTVRVDVPEELAVLADPRALEQILVNLIDNAIKHGFEGASVEVSAEATPSGDRVRIAVNDDGPGIATGHRDRVFERFYRIDPGRSRAVGGTGLGLSIVKHLAEAMNGHVGVESREPRGSRFYVELPIP